MAQYAIDDMAQYNMLLQTTEGYARLQLNPDSVGHEITLSGEMECLARFTRPTEFSGQPLEGRATVYNDPTREITQIILSVGLRDLSIEW